MLSWTVEGVNSLCDSQLRFIIYIFNLHWKSIEKLISRCILFVPCLKLEAFNHQLSLILSKLGEENTKTTETDISL